MKHGRPDRAWVQLTAQRYSGTHAGAWVGDLMEWRRQHAQCVWQAMQAVLMAIAVDELRAECDRKQDIAPWLLACEMWEGYGQ